METGQDLLEQVRSSYHRLSRPDHIMLALSGGPDSVALLHILIALRKDEGFSLTCVHINHGIRAASEAEQKWVIGLAGKIGFPLILKRVTVSSNGNLEAAARDARYAAFREAMTECGADALALAHHADDQAETLLMHLMRGSGSDGLAGMKEYIKPLWRPFLHVTKEQILDYLRTGNTAWVKDESNADTRYLRNRLRLQLLPLMEDAFPGTVLRMSQTAEILQAEQELFTKLEDQWLALHGKMSPPFAYLNYQNFGEEHLAMQRRLVRRLCGIYGIPLDFAQTERLRRFAEQPAGSLYTLPGGAMAQMSEKRLHIIPNEIESYHVTWAQPFRDGPGKTLGDGLREQVFDAELLSGALMREAKPDDRICPLGMSGSQSLLKYLSSRRVDLPFRRFWPVYARDSEVLWVPGCGVAQTAAVNADTRSRVRLSFQGELPDENKLEVKP
jgi:tRNA(Ile)-lysidine synthase